MSQTTSIALAWSNDSFPPPDVIWKKAVDDQTLYFSGWSLKMRSEGQALPSSPNLGNAKIKIKPAMRAKTNITPVYQPSPRNHCVDLMSRFRSWNAPLNQVIARLNMMICGDGNDSHNKFSKWWVYFVWESGWSSGRPLLYFGLGFRNLGYVVRIRNLVTILPHWWQHDNFFTYRGQVVIDTKSNTGTTQSQSWWINATFVSIGLLSTFLKAGFGATVFMLGFFSRSLAH